MTTGPAVLARTGVFPARDEFAELARTHGIVPVAIEVVADTLTPVAAFGYAAVQLIRAAVRRTNATNRLALIRAIANGGAYDTEGNAFGILEPLPGM